MIVISSAIVALIIGPAPVLWQPGTRDEMPDKTWKMAERRVAARFGTQRTGPQGRNTPDVVTSDLSIEVKTRKALPAWLHEALAQSERNAQPGTLPVVVLHQVGTRYDDDMIVMSMKSFTQWRNRGERVQDL